MASKVESCQAVDQNGGLKMAANDVFIVWSFSLCQLIFIFFLNWYTLHGFYLHFYFTQHKNYKWAVSWFIWCLNAAPYCVGVSCSVLLCVGGAWHKAVPGSVLRSHEQRSSPVRARPNSHHSPVVFGCSADHWETFGATMSTQIKGKWTPWVERTQKRRRVKQVGCLFPMSIWQRSLNCCRKVTLYPVIGVWSPINRL